MKIRIKGNSIRIRLTRPEVEYFKVHGSLEEKTDFGKSTFVYALKTKESDEKLSAEFSKGAIIVFIPLNLAKEWATTEKVGCESEMETGEGKKLYILLEKDFKCLDNVGEDQNDQYENPISMK